MQLISPVFLLVFLPLSLLVLLPFPKRVRPTMLAFVSALWYVLANLQNLMGMANLAALCAFTAIIVLPPSSFLPRVRLFLGTVSPLALLISARLGAELGVEGFSYPYGLTFVVLASISVVIDRLWHRAPAPRHIGELFSYLLCFPLLTAGPLITWKTYREALDNMELTLTGMADGIRLYMRGAAKCIAVAAVSLRSIQEILPAMETDSHYLILLILPLLGFMALHFFFSGACEMGRGIMGMMGISLPRARKHPQHGIDPARVVWGMMPSLYSYLLCYVGAPLQRLIKGKAGRVVSLLAILLLWLPFFRTHPAVFLFLPPLFLLLLPSVLRTGRRHGDYSLQGVLLTLPAFVAIALFSLVVLSDSPRALLELALRAELKNSDFFYYFHNVVAEIRYLLIGLAVAALFLLLALLRRQLTYRRSTRLIRIEKYTETVLLFLAFILAFIYFVPQFPGYATLPHPSLYF